MGRAGPVPWSFGDVDAIATGQVGEAVVEALSDGSEPPVVATALDLGEKFGALGGEWHLMAPCGATWRQTVPLDAETCFSVSQQATRQ